MLLAIKDRVTGWFAWCVVLLISVPFVLWGVQEYTGMGNDNFAVKVNDTEISFQDFEQEISRNRQQLRQSFGGRIPTYFDAEAFLRTQTVSQLINRELYNQIIEDNRYRVPVQQVLTAIMADPGFQKDGVFNRDYYKRQLTSIGLSEQGYERSLREQMLALQIQDGIRKTAFLTQEEIADYAKLRYQNRSFEYVVSPLEKHTKRIKNVTEKQISDYYAKNAESYKTEEKAKIEYLELDLATLLAGVSMEGVSLESLYDEAVADGRFQTEELRNASHILLKVPADAEDDVVAEKEKEIQALRDRIINGESFSKLAKQFSEDPGSASRDGSLGDVQRGAMVKPFEDALFAAELNKVTKPVKTQFGFHLILVNKIIESKVQAFAEVKDELEQDYRKKQAGPIFYDLLDDLANAAFENPEDLAIVAEKIGAEVKNTDWFTMSKGDGIAANAQVRQAAFSDEVLKEGNNSTPLEIEPEHVVVLRVSDHEPSRTKTLDEARAEISATLKAQLASEALEDELNKLLESYQSGQKLERLAKNSSLEFEKVTSRRDNSEISSEILKKAFTMHLSAEGKPVADKLIMTNGDGAIIRLIGQEAGDIKWLDDAEKKKLVGELVQARGQYDLTALIAERKEKSDITIHPDLQ